MCVWGVVHVLDVRTSILHVVCIIRPAAHQLLHAPQDISVYTPTCTVYPILDILWSLFYVCGRNTNVLIFTSTKSVTMAFPSSCVLNY